MEEGGRKIFHLTYNRFSTVNQRIASGFACVKFSQVSTFGKDRDIQPLLSKVKVQDGSTSFLNRNITEKQVNYIRGKLRATVRRLYGEGYQEELEEKLLSYNQREASNLIFAIKFSITSLHIRWQLLQLLGPDKKLLSEMENTMVKHTTKHELVLV